jgi:hypothetical protein
LSDLTGAAWTSPLVLAFAFAALWIGVSSLVSYLSGWVSLAQRYRATGEASGIPVRVGVARLGRSGIGRFRNVLTVWVGAGGLRLHLLFLFGINSRDLFVPWPDISVSRGRHFFADYVEFRFRGAPDIPLRIFGLAADQVRAAAGPHWPEDVARD